MAKSAHHDMHIATCGTGKATYDTKNPVALEGNSRRGVRRQVRPHAYLDAAGACAAVRLPQEAGRRRAGQKRGLLHLQSCTLQRCFEYSKALLKQEFCTRRYRMRIEEVGFEDGYLTNSPKP